MKQSVIHQAWHNHSNTKHGTLMTTHTPSLTLSLIHKAWHTHTYTKQSKTNILRFNQPLPTNLRHFYMALKNQDFSKMTTEMERRTSLGKRFPGKLKPKASIYPFTMMFFFLILFILFLCCFDTKTILFKLLHSYLSKIDVARIAHRWHRTKDLYHMKTEIVFQLAEVVKSLVAQLEVPWFRIEW